MFKSIIVQLTDRAIADVIIGSDHAEIQRLSIHIIDDCDALKCEIPVFIFPHEQLPYSTSIYKITQCTLDCSKSLSVFSTNSDRLSDR